MMKEMINKGAERVIVSETEEKQERCVIFRSHKLNHRSQTAHRLSEWFSDRWEKTF
jgi:hypothetical protein